MNQEKCKVWGSLRARGSVVGAFSGGVDRSLVAYLEATEVGDCAEDITAGLPSIESSDYFKYIILLLH